MIARPRVRRRGAARWALAALMIAAAPAVAACDGDDEAAPAVEATYRAGLEELNRSGVSGEATIGTGADVLRVQIRAEGMVPDMEHAQHIHQPTGAVEGACPTPEADGDGDGLVSLEEGAPAYGPVVLPLEPFPMAELGEVDFVEDYEPLGSDARPLDDGVVVLHGGIVGGEYLPTLPVACGTIEPVTTDAGTVTDEETEPRAGTVTEEVTGTTTDTGTVTEQVTVTETETEAGTGQATETAPGSVTEQAPTGTAP